jgi:ABC-type ATPase with predicted acetyltransferase domain
MVDQTIDQQSSDAVNSVENALASLWDKAREASLLISTLREEKKRLVQRIADLDEEVAHLKHLTVQQQSQLVDLKTESESGKKSSAVSIDIEEKRQLQQKIRTIITKLDQYITP